MLPEGSSEDISPYIASYPHFLTRAMLTPLNRSFFCCGRYLHHDAPSTIIHRDIKPPNILFDADLNAKVADFGLAKEIDLKEQTHLSTAVSGTIGCVTFLTNPVDRSPPSPFLVTCLQALNIPSSFQIFSS
jgi:serine/threonine protein kinase